MITCIQRSINRVQEYSKASGIITKHVSVLHIASQAMVSQMSRTWRACSTACEAGPQFAVEQ